MVAIMYKKIIMIAILAIFVTGCSNPFSSVKPKEPSKKLPVKVVESIEPQKIYTPTPQQSITIEDDTIKTKDYSKKTKSKPKSKSKSKSKSKFKPEPFSVESNQEDPELLGGQGTLKSKLHGEAKSDNNKTKS